jgi:hypothetical protein
MPMVRHILLFFMMVASLTTAATLHAREYAGAADLECSGVPHSEGDTDQAPDDSGKAVQHHGHCHLGAAVVPWRHGVMELCALPSSRLAFANVGVPGRWIRGPNLRPPIS